MIVSVKVSLKINETVSQATNRKWSVITGLMILFLLGYSAFLYLQFQSMDQYLELITGSYGRNKKNFAINEYRFPGT
jgi:hypothetical protein